MSFQGSIKSDTTGLKSVEPVTLSMSTNPVGCEVKQGEDSKGNKVLKVTASSIGEPVRVRFPNGSLVPARVGGFVSYRMADLVEAGYGTRRVTRHVTDKDGAGSDVTVLYVAAPGGEDDVRVESATPVEAATASALAGGLSNLSDVEQAALVALMRKLGVGKPARKPKAAKVAEEETA